MHKTSKIIALFATIGWLAFAFAAFEGFVFWYGGFVFFLWLALGSINYKQETSLWLFKNKFTLFLKFYIFLAALFVSIDFWVGQKIAGLWEYPFYNSLDDWVRLYTILYPFGALAVLELTLFLGFLFKKGIVFVSKPLSMSHRFVDRADILVLASIFIFSFSTLFLKIPRITDILVWLFFAWILIATLKFKYHIRHWLHFFIIFSVSLAISVFLHEIPNTSVFEWRYNDFSVLNQNIFGVRLWVIIGWYVLVLLVLRSWIYFVLKRKLK